MVCALSPGDKMVLLYCILLVDIHSSHIIGPATTKLRGIVVMMLDWHAEGPGFKFRPDHLKLLLHKSSQILYRVKLKVEKRGWKSSNSGNRAQMNFSVTYFFINNSNKDFGSKKILDENFCPLHKHSS